MLTSLALVFLLGFAVGEVFKRLKLPSLLGMILVGIILGPYMLNVLDTSILSISLELRQIALIIILTRAGLALDLSALKKVGRPAILMSFIPATFEIIGIAILAPLLLNISLIDALIMGTVVAAVSPAVIVPRMLRLMHENYGTKKSIPQLIMASASVDDVFVIVLFTSFISLSQGQSISLSSLLQIPISIILGVVVGVFSGVMLSKIFAKIHMRDTIKVILMLCISFLFIAAENAFKGIVPFSALLCIMAIGVAILKSKQEVAKRLSVKFSKLWIGAEILLFVLVGATVDIRYALSAGIIVGAVVVGALLFRILGVSLCLIKTKLNQKERLFCMVSYIPKATVQAAIGSIPLSMGLPCGKIVLTVAIVSIIITAPVGAFLVDILYKKLLTKDTK